MKTTKFTVILPTRERSDVLHFSLQTVVQQDYDNLEIIVSDNHSQDATREVVAAFNDPRIRYINTGKRMAMSANWDFALAHATDGWVTFMGDDDGLPAGAISRLAEIVDATSAQAVRTRFCSYAWPAAVGKANGELIVPMGQGIEVRDAKRWLGKVLSGFEKYTELPLLYNGGFARLDFLSALKARGGNFFRSSIPDVYSAVAIASVLERYVYCHEPLAISGTSKHSTGTSLFSTHVARNAAPGSMFNGEDNLPFHPDMPTNADGSLPRSLHALVYECYLQSQSLRGVQSTEGHARQLAVILASDTAHRVEIREWGRRFAAHHGLDYDDALRRSKAKLPLVLSHALVGKAWRAANSVIMDTPRLPITDVYQASVAIATIRARPSRLASLPQLLKARLASGGGNT